MTTELLTLKSSELRPGDVVHCHGMRCLIDRDINGRAYPTGLGVPDPNVVYWTSALVLNRDEVTSDAVPHSYTETTSYPSRGLPAEPAGTHRWTIQANDLVRWTVERDVSYGRQFVA